jgi:hypothetical protein
MPAVPTRRRIWACGLAACGLGVGSVAHAQAPGQPPVVRTAATQPADDSATRQVAYIYGTVPVTRQDLGEFLMARGGADKLELLVNKKIIEHECAKRNVTVTREEMEAALADDVKGLSIKKEEFIKVVLPRYGKTYYEWMEDVVRPRLLLTKLCKDQVKVTDDDLRKMFEREYGEKRRVQVMMWPLGDNQKVIDEQWAKMRSFVDQEGKIRSNQEEFDSVCRQQANPALASTRGHIKPLSRHMYAEDVAVLETAFKLKVGEVSEPIRTLQGTFCVKLHEVIPPDAKVEFEKVKGTLYQQAYEEKLSQEIPKYFARLKEAARPEFIYTGPDLWKMLNDPARKSEPLLKPADATAPPMK